MILYLSLSCVPHPLASRVFRVFADINSKDVYRYKKKNDESFLLNVVAFMISEIFLLGLIRLLIMAACLDSTCVHQNFVSKTLGDMMF